MSFFDNRHVSGKGGIRSGATGNTSLSANFNRIMTRKILFPIIYHVNALKPIKKDKVVFLEIRFGELTDSYQELFNNLVCNYEMDIHCHFLRQGFVNNRQELKRQIDFLKDAATAGYLIYNDSSDTQGSFKVRRGTRVMNVWHAAGAFKKFGNSTKDKLFNDGKKGIKYNLHPKYDLVTVSSPEIEWAYAEAMGERPECVKGLGISRSDVFYKKEFIDAAFEHLYDIMPAAKEKKVILYAPTFRGTPRDAITPDMFSVKMFYEHLSEDYVLLIKHHPLVKRRPEILSEYSGFAVDMTDNMSIAELLCVSDICITDYSSLIFEYAIFERPILFFAYDLANYFDWRGFYYKFEELTPGPVCYTNAELISFIENIDELFDKEKVKEFRGRFMSGCDGHATERIMKEFFGDRIEKYRRKESIEGDFHTLPDVNTLYRNENKRIKDMEEVMKKASSAYEKAKSFPVENGRIALLADENCDYDVFFALEKALDEDPERKWEVVSDIRFNKKNITEFMKKLAKCEIIVCAGEPFILRMIGVRPETRMIQLSPELLPVYPRWANSIEVRSGFKVKENRLFPIKSEYDLIVGSSERENDFFRKNYKCKQSGKIVNIGNPILDIFRDDDFTKTARARLDMMIPYAEDKRIIAFLCKDREQLDANLAKAMTMLHEDFASTHICICMALDGTPGRKLNLPEYIDGFAFDPRASLSEMVARESMGALDNEKYRTKGSGIDSQKVMYAQMPPLSVLEAIACAEVVVGDYSSRVLACAAANKPLILWKPDRVTFEHICEKYMDMSEVLNRITVSDIKELTEKLKATDEYDYDTLHRIAKEYLCNNDGCASKRFIDVIKS